MDSFTKKQLLWAGAILAGLFALMLHFFWRDLVWTRTEGKVVAATEMCRHSKRNYLPGHWHWHSVYRTVQYPRITVPCSDWDTASKLKARGYDEVREFWRAMVSYPLAGGDQGRSTIDVEAKDVPAQPNRAQPECLLLRCFPKLKPGAELLVSHSPWSPSEAEFAPYTYQRRLIYGFLFLFGVVVIVMFFAAGFAPETQEEADMAEEGPYWW